VLIIENESNRSEVLALFYSTNGGNFSTNGAFFIGEKLFTLPSLF